jgi:hypothetical protein
MTNEENEAMETMCHWMESMESLHEVLKDIERQGTVLNGLFGEETVSLLQITTQGAIHKMLGNDPETAALQKVIPVLDRYVRDKTEGPKNKWDGKH